MKRRELTLPVVALGLLLTPSAIEAAHDVEPGRKALPEIVIRDSVPGTAHPSATVTKTATQPANDLNLLSIPPDPRFGAATDVTIGGRRVQLSREQCIKIALENSPTIRIADLEVRRVDWSKKEVQAQLWPTIDFTGAYQRTIKLQTIRMDMGGQSQSIKMGSDNTWNFGFNASLPLVAPTLWKSIKISDTQILQNLESARASRLDLIDQINKAYYSLLLANSSYEVLRQSYETARLNASIYEKQFSVGTATEYDVLRTQVQVSNMEPELLQAEIAIRQCKLQLKVLMGLDETVDVDPTVTLKEMQQEMYGYQLEDRSFSLNTTLRSLELQQEMAKQNVELKKLAWIPTLAATYNISWLSLSNGNPFKNQEFNPYSTVGLAVQVPIFSGGSKYYGLKGAQVQQKELELQRETLLNNLNMQVDLALDNINKEVRQIASSAEGMRQAQKAYDIMQKSFEIGAATYLNLRDSENANTAAQLTYYQAIYNYLVSTSELDLLLGKEDTLNRSGIEYIKPDNYKQKIKTIE